MTRHTGDQLRAADTDRDAVAERLATAMSEGRLGADEYDQRLGQAYAARTYADLDRLVADLPASTPQRASPQAEPKPAVPLRVLRACVRCCTGLPTPCLILAVLLIVAILP